MPTVFDSDTWLLIGASIIVAGALLVLITTAVRWWNGTRGAEDAIRITNFLAALDRHDWSSPDERHGALDVFRSELLLLFDAEVRYYYSARKRHRPFSVGFRFLGWMFGSLGVIIPAIAAYFDAARDLAPFGYLFLVASGCMFGGNQLFGGTSGHIRYVSAQYELEAHLVAFTIRWERWRALHQYKPVNDDALGEAFALLAQLATTIYGVIRTETGGWAAALQEATRKAAEDVSSKVGASEGKPANSKVPDESRAEGHLHRNAGAH